MFFTKNYFWYATIVFLLFSSGVLASPEMPDEKHIYGEIHTEVDKNLFRLLGIEESAKYIENSQMYEYTITLGEQIYPRVKGGYLILRAVLSGSCECESDKVLLVWELTSKVNRLSSSQKTNFFYSAEFKESYLDFKKNNRYLFKRKTE